MIKIKQILLVLLASVSLTVCFGCYTAPKQEFKVTDTPKQSVSLAQVLHCNPKAVFQGNEMDINPNIEGEYHTYRMLDYYIKLGYTFPHASDFEDQGVMARKIIVTLKFAGEQEYSGEAWDISIYEYDVNNRQNDKVKSLMYVYPAGEENGHLVIEARYKIDYSKTYINYDENLQIYYYVANCVVITDNYYNKYQGKQMTLTYDYELPIRSTVN
ncbi:MAG: hypothetical protein IJW13_00230 [Clostridia bacterium]|nr:hypothetical protein [Clostridia bacterium]